MKLNIHYHKAWICLMLLLTSVFCFAQEQADTTSYRIETRDGNIYTGRIIAQDSLQVIFQSDQLGEIHIQRARIKEIHPIEKDKIKDGTYWFESPQATRYFYSPNGYALKKGEGYYQNVWVLFNSLAFGITDHVSFGAGLVPLFLFAGAPTPVWITPKLSIPISEDKMNLGAGALMGFIVGEERAGFGIVYGITTFGSKDQNVSFGLGYGYAAGEWARWPMLNLNAMIRTGPRGYLLTENYFLRTGQSTTVILWLGGRQMIKKAGLDYGLMIPWFDEMEDLVAIPWLGLTIPFEVKN